jgi:hypothetical protein
MPATQKIWKPSARQAEFLALPDDIFEALYGGAAGGGKSEVLLALPLVREFYKNPKFHGIIFRRTFPELEESLILRSKTGLGNPDDDVSGPSYYDFGGAYNAQQHVWTFKSGATIRFSYMETDDDARSHKTAEYNYIGFDELTAFTQFQYTYLTSRCRSGNNLPRIVRAATNPEGVGLAWVRERFVEPAKEGHKKIFDRKSKSFRIFIPAKLKDNPYLDKKDPNYRNRLAILPEAERRALVEGDWFIFSGQVFTEFRAQSLPDEPANAIHVIEPFPIPDWWPKILAVDWGYAHKTSALWAAVSPEGRVYVYNQYVGQKEYISTWASNIRRMSQFDENLGIIVLDPSAWNTTGVEKTIAEQFHDSSGFNPSKADNDRVGGKLLVHEFLRWRSRPHRYKPSEGYSPEKAQDIWRRHGETAQKEYEKMFLPEDPETNLPKLQIFSHCTDLVKTIPLMVYSDKDPGYAGTLAEDVKKVDGDDSYDCLRYLLKAVNNLVLSSKREAEDRRKLGLIIANLGMKTDKTDFYIQMAKYDSDHSRETKSVSRNKSFFYN